MTWAIAWGFLKSLPWKWICIALAVAAALSAYGHREYARGAASRDPEVAALNGTITNLKAASAKAAADNHAFVERINAQQAQITKDRNDEAPKLLAAGSSAIDRYIRLHPAPAADPRLPYATGTPGVPYSTAEPDADLTHAVVSRDDLTACNESYVVATGLQGWLRDQAAIDRKEPSK